MRKIGATVVGLLLAVAGCAGSGRREPPGGTPEVHAAWQSCAAEQQPSAVPRPAAPAEQLPRLGSGFTPVAVVVCTTVPRSTPAGGEDLVAAEQRAGSVDALTAALRLRDERPARGPCTADLVTLPWFALLDAQQRWVRVSAPVDGCGKPRAEVRAALAGLRLTTVTSSKVGEITSSAAAAAGCEQHWADMVSVTARGRSTAAPPAGYAPAPGSTVRLCVYRVPANERSSGKPAGTFVAGGLLGPTRWAAIRAALPHGVPARPCSSAAGRFAVLRPTGAGEIYVELDGCHRLLSTLPSGGLGQATPALVTTIESAAAHPR